MPEAGCKTAGAGEQAPDQTSAGDQPNTVGAIRQHRRRYADQSVEQRKAQPGQQTQLGVAQVEFGADGFRQNRQNLAIHKIYSTNRRQHQQRQRPSGTGWSDSGRRKIGGRSLVHLTPSVASFCALLAT
jgi:hypothetical protein